MAIELGEPIINQLSYLIDTYMKDELDIELSDFKLEMFTKYVADSFAPTIYNSAIKDAHAYVVTKAADMEMDLYAEERR
ncbi:MAG: DUF2164 domain-containing protein [Fibrobacterales bacterium]